MNKRLAIIGSSDLGQLIAHHASLLPGFRVVGFYDDYVDSSELRAGFPILGKIAQLRADYAAGVFDELMVGIGYNHMSFRESVFTDFSKGIPFATVIHPSASIDPSVHISAGCFVLPGCVLDRNVVLEENVLLNTGVVIAHDSKVGAHSFVSPAVKIAGFTKIGIGCVIGIGSILIDNIELADYVRTGAGTLVVKTLTKSGLYFGSPAKHREVEN